MAPSGAEIALGGAAVGGVGVGVGLARHPGERAHVGALVVVLPLGHRGLVGLVGDHHHQHVVADVAAGLGGGLAISRSLVGAMRGRRVDALAQGEVVVAVGRAELHAARALAGADDLHVGLRARAQLAVRHLEVLALEVGRALLPELAQDGDVFGCCSRSAWRSAPRPATGPSARTPPSAQPETMLMPKRPPEIEIDGRGHARHDRPAEWSAPRPRRRAGCAR